MMMLSTYNDGTDEDNYGFNDNELNYDTIYVFVVNISSYQIYDVYYIKVVIINGNICVELNCRNLVNLW